MKKYIVLLLVIALVTLVACSTNNEEMKGDESGSSEMMKEEDAEMAKEDESEMMNEEDSEMAKEDESEMMKEEDAEMTKEDESEMMKEDESASEEMMTFTKETLAQYNGKNGARAYVAYEGKVYDVTDIPAWSNGTHRGQFEAGKDYTDILNNSAPHSSSNLTDNAPIVGTYTE